MLFSSLIASVLLSTRQTNALQTAESPVKVPLTVPGTLPPNWVSCSLKQRALALGENTDAKRQKQFQQAWYQFM